MSEIQDTISDVITSPVTGLIGLLTGVLHVAGYLDLAWGFVSANAGTGFTIIAVSAGTILPEFGYAELGTKLLVGAALAYVTILLVRLYQRGESYFDK